MILNNKNSFFLPIKQSLIGLIKNLPAWGSNLGHYFISMNTNVPGSIPTSGGFLDPMRNCFLTIINCFYSLNHVYGQLIAIFKKIL